MLILKIGGMVSIGFEQPLMMGNSMVKDVSEVLSTYAYTVGIEQGNLVRLPLSALFQSAVNLTLVLGANKLCAKISGESIW